MSITPMSDNLNIIAALSDRPNATDGLTAAQLKAKYDQGPGLIKTYINGTLVTAVDLAQLGSVSRQAAINGNFAVNSRAKSGTVTLTAGTYGHDRWKAGASGCTYTFATSANVTTITITAGSLLQVIEGANLFSGTYTLSWTGTAQGKIGAGSYGSSGITGTATGGTDLNIEFNAGTLSKVQFNAGAAALPFQPRSTPEEKRLCNWFNQRLSASSSNPYRFFGNGQATTTTQADVFIPIDEMRITPTYFSAGNLGLVSANGTVILVTAVSVNATQSNSKGVRLTCTVASGLVAGNAVALVSSNDATTYINFDAEL